MDLKLKELDSSYDELLLKFSELKHKLNDIEQSDKKKKIYRSKKFSKTITNLYLHIESLSSILEDSILDVDSICIKKELIEPNDEINKLLNEYDINNKVLKAFTVPMFLYRMHLQNEYENKL